MLIGLISDTHIPDAVLALPPQVSEVFSGVDLILHAGDIFEVSVLDQLGEIAPVLAAQGDSDYAEVRNDSRVKEEHVLEIGDTRICLWHDERRSWHGLCEEPPDAIVFGHTHWPVVKRQDGTLFVCPGSPTYPAYRCRLGTVGLLRIAPDMVEAEIIQLTG